MEETKPESSAAFYQILGLTSIVHIFGVVTLMLTPQLEKLADSFMEPPAPDTEDRFVAILFDEELGGGFDDDFDITPVRLPARMPSRRITQISELNQPPPPEPPPRPRRTRRLRKQIEGRGLLAILGASGDHVDNVLGSELEGEWDGIGGLGIRGEGPVSSLTAKSPTSQFVISGIGDGGVEPGVEGGVVGGVVMGRLDELTMEGGAPRARVRRTRRFRVDGPLEREAVAKMVARKVGQIQRCYRDELEKQPDLEGKVVVEWTVESNGRVSQTRVTEISMLSIEVGECITKRIRSWRFPRHHRSTVIYPFIFENV